MEIEYEEKLNKAKEQNEFLLKKTLPFVAADLSKTLLRLGSCITSYKTKSEHPSSYQLNVDTKFANNNGEKSIQGVGETKTQNSGPL